MKLWETIKSVYELHKKQSTAAFVFHRWAEATTAHGFLDLSRAKSFYGKIIWMVLIAVSWIFMCYQVSRAIKDYAGHEWASVIKENAADPTIGLPFPSIVVCNVNRFKWSKALEYGMTLEMINFVFSNLIGSGLEDRIVDPTTVAEFTKWREEKNMSYFRMFEAIGPKYEDIIFVDVDGINATVTPIDTYEYGRCYYLELNYSSQLVGSKGGKTLYLDTQGWDYVPLVGNNYIYQGLMLQLTYDRRVELGQWIKLYPATHNTVGMQAFETGVRVEERSFLNPFAYLESSPPCAKKPQLALSDPSLYSASTCFFECGELLPMISVCQCIPFMSSDRYHTCEIDELYACYLALDNSTYANETLASEVLQVCLRNCPQPCYSKYIETQVSMTQLPSTNQRQKFQDWLTKRKLDHVQMDDIIVVEIFFTSLSTQFIERYEVMSFDNMVSSCGGLIGLWAGMSFLTVFQAIAFLIEYVEISRKKQSTKLVKEGNTDSASAIPQ